MHPREPKKIDRYLLALALTPVFALPVAAEEQQVTKTVNEMVVTATRSATSLQETTKSIAIIGADERDDQQQYFLPDLLDNQPGMYVTKLGGLGQWTNLSIRGTGAQYTQYQYNGMPLRDAADTQSTIQYFLQDMYSGSNLDRVEILKGTNSTLYGSQAMGGVVNIIPQKWQSGLKAEWRNEVGPNSTYIGNARIAYGMDKYYIDFNPMYITTDGEKYGGKNGYYYDNTGATFGAGVKPTDSTSLEFTGIFGSSDLALGKSPSLDASGNLIKNHAYSDQHREGELYQLGLNGTQAISSLWDYTLKGTHGGTERHYFWSTTPGDQSNYDGKTTYIETQQNLHLNNWLTLNIGADYEKSDYDGKEPKNKYAGNYTPVIFDESWGNKDVFSQAQLVFMDRSLFINMGGRYNDHDEFDGEAVWETSAAYIFKATDTKVHGHVGTGYRTPSLYEIYGGYLSGGNLVTIGNPELTPEKSIGYELGLDQSFAEGKVKIGATYFSTYFDDMIIFDNTEFRYANASEGESSGVETFVSLQAFEMVRFDLGYTYTDSRYKADKNATDWTRKEYLPRNKVDFIVTFFPVEKLTMAVDIKWHDEQIVPLNDASYTKVRWEEESVTTVHLSTTYKVMQNIDLFARVDNLFDKDYTESGYCMPGISVYGGIKLHF